MITTPTAHPRRNTRSGLWVTAAPLLNPPHFLEYFDDFGCGGPACMRVRRLQGDAAQTWDSGCAPRSDCPSSVAVMRRIDAFGCSQGCGAERSEGVSPASLSGVPPPGWAALPGVISAPHLFNGPATLGFSGGMVYRFNRQKQRQRRFCNLFA